MDLGERIRDMVLDGFNVHIHQDPIYIDRIAVRVEKRAPDGEFYTKLRIVDQHELFEFTGGVTALFDHVLERSRKDVSLALAARASQGGK